MADELDDILRAGLQSEMVGWAPGAPVEITRVHLAGRIRARRRNQAVGAVVAASAAALVWSLPHTGAASQPPGQPDALQIAPAPTSTLPPRPPATPPPGTAPTTPPVAHVATPGPPRGSAGPHRPAASPGAARLSPSPTSAPGPVPTSPTTTPVPPTTLQPEPTVPASVPASVPTTVAGPGATDTTLPQISVPAATTTVPTTPGTGPLVLTNSALGGTVSVTIGTTIELELSGCPGTVWTPLTAPVQSVVRVTAFNASPATGAAVAEIRAASAGRVTLHLVMSSTCTTSLGGVGLTIVVH